MENVVVEDGLVNVAVRVQRVRVRCLLRGQPVLEIIMISTSPRENDDISLSFIFYLNFVEELLN